MRPLDGVLLFLAAVVVLAVGVDVRKECFEAQQETQDAERKRTDATRLVVATFTDVLHRPPNRYELDSFVRRVDDKGLSRFALENILLNSEEYRREVKTQSDDVAAELRRVNSEQYVVSHISDLYEQVRGGAPPPRIVLPLKDVYQELGPQDDSRFSTFLADKAYPDWENDVLLRMQDNYDTPTTLDIYKTWFGGGGSAGARPQVGVDERVADSATYDRLTRDEARVPKDVAFDRPSTWDADARSTGFDQCQPNEEGAHAPSSLRSVDDADASVGPVVSAIAADKPLRLYFDPEKDLVLDPSLRWKLPDRQPPVCTTLRDPLPTQAYTVVAGELTGTPLKDVMHNDIVQYELRQYVEIPRDEVRLVDSKRRVATPRAA